LAERLLLAASWLRAQPTFAPLPLGLFGASTGSAAALVAAARQPEWFSAVVSRGGRPDLAATALPRVKSPTLLIVGALDEAVIRLNEQALALLRTEKRLEIVPGASHLFEEPGTLAEVARLAGAWFERHLPAPSAHSRRPPPTR
jgi:putative phosphoribosyl transferase